MHIARYSTYMDRMGYRWSYFQLSLPSDSHGGAPGPTGARCNLGFLARRGNDTPLWLVAPTVLPRSRLKRMHPSCSNGAGPQATYTTPRTSDICDPQVSIQPSYQPSFEKKKNRSRCTNSDNEGMRRENSRNMIGFLAAGRLGRPQWQLTRKQVFDPLKKQQRLQRPFPVVSRPNGRVATERRTCGLNALQCGVDLCTCAVRRGRTEL